MLLKSPLSTLVKALLAAAVISILTPCAGAQTYKVLYSFTGGTDGGGVWSSVVMDKLGNLYGTTSGGGAYNYGTVFELSPNSDGTWSESVLHSFMNGDPDGQEPQANLIFDAAGNLYGTAPLGGKHNAGTVFELTPGSSGWSLTLLYTFGSYKGDAGPPRGGLLIDAQGNLFGTAGGGMPGAGAIFELSPGTGSWTESLVYNFGANKGATGNFPSGDLIFDSAGNLYGTTYFGGDLSCGNGGGCGLAYKLWRSSSGWKESVLHNFGSSSKDGQLPVGQVTLDASGNVYGATSQGGSHSCFGTTFCGTVFKLTRSSTQSWKETIPHQFSGGAGGSTPGTGVTFDRAGNLYGTAAYGGQGCGCGVIYKLTPVANSGWTYSVVHNFSGSDGAQPTGTLIMDAAGNLYGTSVLGGSGGSGVVYEITP